MKLRTIATPLFCLAAITGAQALWANSTPATDAAEVITPASAELSLEIPDDYMAQYSSAFSPTGAFTLMARRSGDAQTLMLADIIPMPDSVIVSQRHLELPSMRLIFSAGPYMAWGLEFIVTSASRESHSWVRVPIAGGETKRFAGPIPNEGTYSDMFSPFLAALMPRETGSTFSAPATYPRADETVSVEMDTYEVLGRETLDLGEGLGCECWKIEKRSWSGSVEHVWVDRKAPYVFKRVRDPGGEREFTSDLLAFNVLGR